MASTQVGVSMLENIWGTGRLWLFRVEQALRRRLSLLRGRSTPGLKIDTPTQE